MENLTNIEIHLDATVKDNKFFHGMESIEVNKTELFKYGIMMWEVPSHIVESNFDYLQDKIPALELLLSDFIEFSVNSIINLSNDDRIKKLISEVAGVGLGLKYSTHLLKTNPNKFKKIGTPNEGKYLDYSTISDLREYEIETKGTVNKYYSSMKKDILEKKKNPDHKNVHLRFGTISLLKNKGENSKSKCVIVDDPPEDEVAENDDTFETQLLSYAIFLSYIIDSTYYNKYIKQLQKRKLSRIRINNAKFFGKYKFQEKIFFGECFDYRLIRENFEALRNENIEIENFFRILTEQVGITKIFIGLDEKVITAINKKDESFLNDYEADSIFIDDEQSIKFLDKDGILIVKSKNRSDNQLEEVFPESEVEKRLGLFDNYIKREAHLCKAPCRSKDKEGKPCEIMTFRENCHFHR